MLSQTTTIRQSLFRRKMNSNKAISLLQMLKKMLAFDGLQKRVMFIKYCYTQR